VIVYVLFFGTGMAYAVVSRKMGAWSYKAGIAVALVAGFAFGVVQHGPCRGLEKSGEPGVLQRAHAEPTQPELKPTASGSVKTCLSPHIRFARMDANSEKHYLDACLSVSGHVAWALWIPRQ
jgi:hypothetical protein